jgi:Tol biopolymer transport system component
MRKNRTMILALATTLTLPLAFAQKDPRAEAQLQAAINKETVEGDLKGAIEQYKKLAKSSNRPVAAKALLHLAECYEKQGNAEARKTFEQVVKEFADQPDTVAQARTRLAVLPAAGEMSKPVMGLSIRQLDIDLFDHGFPYSPSPDGRYIAFEDDEDRNVAVYDLNAKSYRKLTQYSKGSTNNPHFSPDGTKIVYCLAAEQTQKWEIMDSDGRNPRTFYTGKTRIGFEDWYPDGKSFLATLHDEKDQPRQLARISIQDGSVVPIPLKVPISFSSYGSYRLSPDGRYITILRSLENDGSRSISVISAAGGDEVQLISEKNNMYLVGWDLQGRSILFTSDRSGSVDLWRIPVNEGKRSGTAEIAKADIGDLSPFGITRNGSIFFYKLRRSEDISVATIDWKTGNLTSSPIQVNNKHLGSSRSPAWSPDGQRLAFLAAATPSEQYSSSILCIWSPQDGNLGEFVLKYPLEMGTPGLWWSSDGQFIFGITQLGMNRGFVRIECKTGSASLLATIPHTIFACAPDGKIAYIWRSEQGTRIPLVIAHNVATGGETELYRSDSPSSASDVLLWRNGPVSPDGKWIALLRNTLLDRATYKYRSKLLLIPTGGGPVREVLSKEGKAIDTKVWAPDGRSLYYSTGRESGDGLDMFEISIEGSTPRRLGQIAKTTSFSTLSPNSDGKRIAFTSLGSGEESFWVMENLPPLKSVGK